MAHSRSIIASLRGSQLLRGVAEDTLLGLASASGTSSFAEGENLWHAGQVAQSFTIIQRGLVQIERQTASSERTVVGIFGPRESVGDAAALEQAPYPADAVAVTAVEVVRVPASVVAALTERDPLLTRSIQAALLEHTRALVTKIDIISAGSVSARLAVLLLHLHERFGDEDEQGQSTVPIPVSRTALARLISARSETVIRALSSLLKDGVLVSIPDGFAIPDLERLREVARAG